MYIPYKYICPNYRWGRDIGRKALIAVGKPGEGRRAWKWGTRDHLFPHPSQKAQCIVSFHVRTLKGGGREGLERVQKTSTIQKKPPNLSNVMEKGWGGVQKAMGDGGAVRETTDTQN